MKYRRIMRGNKCFLSIIWLNELLMPRTPAMLSKYITTWFSPCRHKNLLMKYKYRTCLRRSRLLIEFSFRVVVGVWSASTSTFLLNRTSTWMMISPLLWRSPSRVIALHRSRRSGFHNTAYPFSYGTISQEAAAIEDATDVSSSSLYSLSFHSTRFPLSLSNSLTLLA